MQYETLMICVAALALIAMLAVPQRTAARVTARK